VFLPRGTSRASGAPVPDTRRRHSPDDDDADDDDDDARCYVSVRRRASTAGGTPVRKPSTPCLQSVTVNLTPNLYSYLRRQAAAKTTSVSQLLRELLLQLQTEQEKRHDHAAPTSLSASATGGAERPLRRLNTGSHLV
jgi:hypothetical protein